MELQSSPNIIILIQHVKNLPAWPTSPPPREEKNLAPRRFRSKYVRATMRAIVDFSVPAKPFSQKIYRSSCPLA